MKWNYYRCFNTESVNTVIFYVPLYCHIVPFFYRKYLNYYGVFVIYILCANFTVSHFSYLVEKSPRKRLEKKKIVKNMSGTFSFKLNVKKTYHDVNTFCRSNFCVPPVASRRVAPAPPLHTQIWTLRVIT